MNLSRTDESLLRCLRMAPGEEDDGRLAALSSSDWDALIEAAGRHYLAPLLYRHLKAAHSDTAVPAGAMEKLRREYLESAGRAVSLHHELGEVLRLLRQACIPVIVLKGAHLATLVYGDIALRPMGDLDILVHEADLMRAEAAMLEAGYAPNELNRRIAKDNCHFRYWPPSQEFIVEVHWHFLPSRYHLEINIDEQWQRSRPAVVADADVSILCPEDLLLHLCLHASKHVFEIGLKPFYDIRETLECYGKDIDWKQVEMRGKQWGEAKCVYLTLRLAVELAGASVPDDLMKALEPDDLDERLVLLARERVFAYGQPDSDGLTLSPKLAQLWGSKRLLSKVALILRRAFPSPGEMTRIYPAPSDSVRIYFYYPLRLKTLLARHGRQWWRLLSRDGKMRGLAEQKNELTLLEEWLMAP